MTWTALQLGDGDVLELLKDGVDWDTSGQYDGWERAGGESWMRTGHDEGGEPVLIQKSGNPDHTYQKGQRLEEAGAHIIPTLLVGDQDSLEDPSQKTKGPDYDIFQEHVPDQFDEVYPEVADEAIVQLAENAAAMDALGYDTKSGNEYNRMMSEMLSDGQNCYIVDFGADIGNYGDEQTDSMYHGGRDFLNDEHQDLFEQAYDAAMDELDVDPV